MFKNSYQVFFRTCNKLCREKHDMHTESGIRYIAYCGIQERSSHASEVHYLQCGEHRFILLTALEKYRLPTYEDYSTQYGFIDRWISVPNEFDPMNYTIYADGPLSKFGGRTIDGYGRQFQGLISKCSDILMKHVAPEYQYT